MHMLFLSSDRWNYFNMGGAAVAGIGIAINPGWTFMVNNIFSLDSGNLGGNRYMELFDMTYQYQLSVGVRYSKKLLNNSAIFMPGNE